jgi:tetratricopeptide (TPR) repeat protein
VALKVLRPELAASIGTDRFLREIRIAAQLNHPHILPLHDSGSADGFLYHVMPFVEGETLRDRLRRERQLPLDVALQITREVADALGYAHELGIVHRDIKPENILFQAGHAVVSDFGIARAVSAAGGEQLTETGLAVGTPEYMSPEQASGDRAIDGRSDLYALGCLLYEMLGGDPPFTGSTPQAVLARKVVDPVPALHSVRETVPESLERVVLKALAKAPADRFASAQELLDALRDERLSVPSVGPAAAAWRWRFGWRSAIAAAVAVLLLGVGGWLLSRGNGRVATVEVSPHRIAVFPFEVQAGPERQYLGAGVMTLLASAIDGAGELRGVDPQALRTMVRRLGYDAVGPEEGREVATHFGAGRYLLGTVVATGADVNISTSLYDPEQGDIAAATVVVEGAEEDLSGLVTSLARQLLEHPVMGMEARIGEISEIRTESHAALKAYLEGEELFWRGRYDSAVAAFERAVAEDSLFALAWFRLRGAYEWRSPGDLRGPDALRRAMALRERLSDKDRLYVEMHYWGLGGNREDMEALALQAVTQYPDDVESWYGLAILRDFYRWQDPRPLSEALDAYRRALELDPEHPQVLWNYTWALRRARQHALVDSLYRAAEEDGRELVFPFAHDALMAVLFGDEATRDSTIDALVHGFDEPTGRALHSSAWVVQWLNTTSDSLELARRVVQSVFLDPPRPNVNRAWGHWMSQALEVASGRWSSAVAHAAAAGRVDSSYASFGYVLLAMTPFLPLAQHEIAAVRDSLLRIESWHDRDPEIEPPPEWHWIDVQPYMRPYLQGILSGRLGDYPQALDYAATLESLVQPSDSVGLANDLSLEIRALVAAAQRRTEQALALIERQGLRLPALGQADIVALRPLGRLIRAELLLQLGRHEEALAWFDSYPFLLGTAVLDFGYLSHSYGRMGEMYDALGDREKAIEYYNRFVARWKNAEPALQPRVEAARARLAELVEG